MTSQIWKLVIGWEGRYEVSNDGQVRSWWYGKKHLSEPRILKIKIDRYGYPVVCLHHKERKKYPPIHKLVAQAFIPKANEQLQVNHIDGNKQNNKVSNLEWVTNKENMNHAFKTGLIAKENPSAGRKRRYKSAIERELSQKRAKALWADGSYKEKMQKRYNSEEYITELRERRKNQKPPTLGRKRINNGSEEKAVKQEEVSIYLKNGWNLGRLFFNTQKRG